MPSSRCCGTSVGIIARNETGHLLMITRGWYPVGIAPVAGHVADAHTNAAAALVAEVREETGLTVTSHERIWEGWLPNLCASPPAPIPGHHWVLARATVTGILAPDPEETRGADWYGPLQVAALAERTLAWARGEIDDDEFEHEPGLEPVWGEHLATAGILRISDHERALLRRLYTTPPREYWLNDRLVPADVAAR